MPKLSCELIDPDPIRLGPFFREAYGQHYKGDERVHDFYNRVRKAIVIQDSLGSIAAATLIEPPSNDRIIASATSPQTDRFGGRLELMQQVLEASRDLGDARWISIGGIHTRMQVAASAAGMERISHHDEINTILNNTGLDEHYHLTFDENDLAVIETVRGPSSGNTQQVWAWRDQIPPID